MSVRIYDLFGFATFKQDNIDGPWCYSNVSSMMDAFKQSNTAKDNILIMDDKYSTYVLFSYFNKMTEPRFDYSFVTDDYNPINLHGGCRFLMFSQKIENNELRTAFLRIGVDKQYAPLIKDIIVNTPIRQYYECRDEIFKEIDSIILDEHINLKSIYRIVHKTLYPQIPL